MGPRKPPCAYVILRKNHEIQEGSNSVHPEGFEFHNPYGARAERRLPLYDRRPELLQKASTFFFFFSAEADRSHAKKASVCAHHFSNESLGFRSLGSKVLGYNN